MKRMIPSKRVRYLTLLSFISFNIAIRFPYFTHQRGVDTYYIQAFTNSLVHHSHTYWYVHPFTLFGLTPNSYPAGFFYIWGACAKIGNVPLESINIFQCYIITSFGILGMYMLSKHLFPKFKFIILSMFFYSTSYLFFDFSFWAASTRIYIIAFFPFFVWLLLRYNYNLTVDGSNKYNWRFNWKYIILMLLVSIIVLTFHRTGLLFIIIIVCFSGSLLLINYLNGIKNPFKIRPIHLFLLYCCAIFVLLLLQSFGVGFYGQSGFYFYKSKGFLFQGTSWYVLFINNFVDYAARMGFSMLFIPFGLIFIFFYNNMDMKSKFFILMLLLILFSIMFYSTYCGLILVPIFCLLSAFGIYYITEELSLKIFRQKRNQIKLKVRALIISFIILMMMVNVISLALLYDHYIDEEILRQSRQPWCTEETYQCALYKNSYFNYANTTSNIELVKDRVDAFSNNPSIFAGIPFGVKVERVKLSDFLNSKTLFSLSSQSSSTRQSLFINGSVNNNENVHILHKHNIQLLVEDNTYEMQNTPFYKSGELREWSFSKSTHETKYMIFTNSRINLFYIY